MNDKILEINNLHKIYPTGFHALKGVSFDVYKGEFLVVIGLSGSGKSTMLRCINRLHDFMQGSILFDKLDVGNLKGNELNQLRTRIGMIFQQFNLIPGKSVLTNVLTGRLGKISTMKGILGLFSKSEIEEAKNNLKIVGLESKANERADKLSGGQQQRVAIARALMQKPEIILADEPVASLDPATSHSVMKYLQEINKQFGVTVICNLHFLSLVRQYATRVIALKGGELIYNGLPSNIDETWFRQIYGEDAMEVTID